MSDEKTEERPSVLRVFQTKAETKAFYNKIARVYDLLAERSERPMRESASRLFAAARGEHILEIGFGTGHCVVDFAHAVGPSGKVYGIEMSEKMCALAFNRAADNDVQTRVTLACGDAEQLPYEPETMDGIFMSFTLELFDTPNIPIVLSECRRVLRPGGRLCVVAVSNEGKRGPVIKAFEWTHRHFPNLVDCRPIYARCSLEESGFVIEHVEVQHMWVPVEIVLATRP